MSERGVIIRFDGVSFEYGVKKPILSGVNFSLRSGAKLTLMGQNGSGKTTIFKLITGILKPDSGIIHMNHGLTIAVARQVIPSEEMELIVRDFFEKGFSKASFAKMSEGRGKIYDIDSKIDAVLEIVNLKAGHDKRIKEFSGGQHARLLLAQALIQEPDMLLLDEPTNNLDKEGIAHLRQFLIDYKKTCVVISHDDDFLNAFTEGVLYLDAHTRVIEQYAGNYYDVVGQISARIEKEHRKNAQLERLIQAKKDQANVFAHKSGQLRRVARKMIEKAEELEEEKVDVRKEDKAIRPFVIPATIDYIGEVLHISSFSIFRHHAPVVKKANISLRKNQHLLFTGPNGIGKSTLLESIAKKKAEGVAITPGVRVGYYSQNFSTLNFDETPYATLASAMEEFDEQRLRSVAAGFLLSYDILYTKIGSLSEGQKGLVSFARLVLQKPGLLLLDEPTNHINFRHIPVIASALNKYTGAMILISHVPGFVREIRIDDILDLEK